MKRCAAKASLQRPYSDQILTAADFFKYCQDNFPNIQCFFTPKAEVEQVTADLEQRFSTAVTILGTQKHHHFRPIGGGKLEISETSHRFSTRKLELGIMSLVMKTIMLNLLTWLVPTLLLPMIQNCGLALSTTGVNSLVTTSSDSFIQQESMPLIHFQTTGVKSASKSKARSKEFCQRQLCLADLQGSGTLFQGKT